MEARVDRRRLQAVIRRAAELYAVESDPHELLSEAEVVRIGEELGLPPRLVRQALYETTDDSARSGAGSWLDLLYGPPLAHCNRTVAGHTATVFDQLVDYLTTREYLLLRRRQGDTGLFEPAGDAISNMARALARPAGRYHLARAASVLLAVRPIDSTTAHVRLTLDLSDRRRRAVIASSVGGGALGTVVGAGVFGLMVAIAGPASPLTIAVATAGGLTGFGVTVAGIFAASANRFRRLVHRARTEVAGLLDKLQRGDRLEPPAAPWWRRMRRISPS
ncbi:MAG TPA: hypothetical protein VNZ57_14570 [Longimicrobiales bacterium]|nr:hypothetical protein [Longimicrobiales bacterium]